MDAQQFLAEFRHIANAPGGIGKLRELVIQLAISGRLVERIESESPVSIIVEDAAELRRNYEVEFDLRATRMHSQLHSQPFPVPEHWKWERLEQICLYIQRGKGPKYVEKSTTNVISQKCVQWTGFDLSTARFVADDSLDSYGKERFLCAGDLLWNSTGTGTAGRVAIYQAGDDVKAVADSHVTVIRLANCFPRFLWCVIASPWVQSRIEPSHPDSLVSGTTQQVELNTSTARALPVPLPPIEEQSRIVAKVDELMTLCDKLETQQKARRKLQNNLRQSTLQAVATASSPQELKTTWTRLADHFEQLFNVPEDVDEVREVIYQLAVIGYLVHQDASEGNAINLLNEIDNNRERLIQERRYKRIMKLESEPLAIPAINLPPSWQWSRLLSLGEVNPRNSAEEDASSSFIPMAGVSKRYNEPLNGAITPWHKISKGYTHFANGDVILAKITPCFENGKSAIIKDLPYKIGAGSTEFHVFRPIHKDVLSSYVYIFLKSPLFRIDGEACMTGTAGQKRLPTDYFALRAIPLPPAKEQIRIVAKVEELMTLCNKFESQLRETRKLAEHLCIAVISNFTGVATEQDEEPMKAPQTELIAPLRLGKAPDIKAQSPLATILARHHGEMPAKDLWQRFGGEIDAFYAQLKTEVAHGWIREPAVAEMREKRVESADA